MAFCKFSIESATSSNTLVDNKFIEQYLPYAPDCCVKVYLLGLYRSTINGSDNTLENFAKTLNMTEEDVENCFLYLQEQGLCTLLNVKPFEVRFLPVKPKNVDVKKYSKSKYASFNKQIQEILDARMITPTEYAEYYALMESMHIEPTALIMIAKYCANLKGNNVGYSYILTVAKNWAYEGVKTANDVEEKLKQHELILSDVQDILKLLGSKKQADFEDKQLYLKWTKQLDFSKEVIDFVALSFKKKGSISSLDKKLEKYFELKLLSLKEIEDYEENKQNLIETAKLITKSIGVYYENLENVIETYIVKWQNMGYDQDSLKTIANFCFKNNIKTLEGMNDSVEKFYSLGLTNLESIKEYFGEVIDTDKKIKKLLEITGLSRSVTTWDRDFYRVWTFTWNFDNDVIEYACSLAVNKSHPLSYVNKILSDWYKNDIKTLEKAKSQSVKTYDDKPATHDFKQRSYSSEEINALFDNLSEVKWK
ncbi:MAG: DnaD domain protein [Clostridiales bacterium]|nr:DnaD domain protein [Candidatus Apopatousia equi]